MGAKVGGLAAADAAVIDGSRRFEELSHAFFLSLGSFSVLFCTYSANCVQD